MRGVENRTAPEKRVWGMDPKPQTLNPAFSTSHPVPGTYHQRAIPLADNLMKYIK